MTDFDLLVLGGLGVDIRVRVPAIPPPAADSITVPPIDLRIGNTGAGVALAADALGLRVALVDVIGDDPAGEVVRAALARTGVHRVLRTDPRGTRRSVNLVDPAGRRMSLYDPRGGWTGRPPFDPDELARLAGVSAHVHVSIMDWLPGLLPALRAGLPPGVSVSTDLHDWDGLNDYHRPFLAAADLVFVSGVRLDEPTVRLATGDRDNQLATGDQDSRLATGDRDGRLATGDRPRTVVVTHGDRGAVVIGPDGSVERVAAATPPGPVVDSNGAGDAYAVGFVAGRLRGLPDRDAARYAAEVAAAACTHDGMEYPPDLLPRN